MATTSTSYSSWKGNSGHSYRLKITINRTSVSTSLNRSTVRVRVWIQSRYSSSFNRTAVVYYSFDGDVIWNNTSRSLSATPNGDRLIVDSTRNVTHNSDGNRSVHASFGFTESVYAGSHSVATTLKLNRIAQFPSAPSSAPTVTRSGSQVTATSANASGNGGSITAYQVRRRHNSSGSYGAWTTTTGKQAKFTASRPPDAYQYQFQSRAETSRGWGPWSATRTITIPAGVIPGEIDGVELSFAPGEITASWEAPPGAVEYEVALHDGTSWGAPVNVGEALEYAFTGLIPGTYQVRVRSAVVGTGWTNWDTSDPEYLGELPGMVPAVLIVDGEAVWEPPTSTGGYDLDGYEVQWYDGIDWSESETVDTLNAGYEAFLPGIGYRCRVAPVNQLGAGAWRTSAYYVDGLCPCTI